MNLAYRAYDQTGREIADVIDAAGTAEAAEALRRKGLYVTEIHPAGASGRTRPRSGARRRGKSRLKNLSTFTRQLYVLVGSGTPLVDALGALRRQAQDDAWASVIADIRSQVEEGKSLCAAMENHSECFDPVYRSLIAAGESSGTLPLMLDRLGALVQKRLHTRNIVLGAMVYPCMLLGIATGVLGVLLIFVIPRFADLFRTLGAPLPGSTKFLIGLSGFLRAYWWALGAAIGGIVVAARLWLRSGSGRRGVDSLLLRLPQIGRITRSFITARITRLLGVLVEGHVPIVEALHLAREAANNSLYAELLSRAEDAVIRGQSVSSVLAGSDLISPSVGEALRSGEQSGQLGRLLLEISDFLDEDNEIILRSLTSIMEPAILVLLGLLVGTIAVSLFTPLFDVTSIMQGGGQ